VDYLALLDAEEADLLPARRTMLTIVLPTIEVANVVGVNLALALNAGTIAATASATAMQTLTANL
jgi:hypothetical protein